MTPSIIKFIQKNIKSVHHVRDTILCPHNSHLSLFFSAIACLILLYSFFLSPWYYGTKSHTVVIIIFYATNDFFFKF